MASRVDPSGKVAEGNNAIGSRKWGNKPNCGEVAQGEVRNKWVKNFLYAEYIKRIEEHKCFHCN